MSHETTMKLSEAIRLGAMMGPQCFGPYAKTDRIPVSWLMGQVVQERTECATCAMGAALLAAGYGKMLELPTDQIHPERVFPVLEMIVAASDVTTRLKKCEQKSIRNVIVDLNDHRHWTREQIADWVATVEGAARPEDEEEVPEADVVPALQAAVR